jgi:uncharacterized protein DUF3857
VNEGETIRLILGCRLPKLLAAAALMLLPAQDRAATSTVVELVPGPQSITREEQALASNAAAGSQHGIILMDETIRDESSGTKCRLWRHVRAKIFTNEGRGLADVDIAFSDSRSLKKWWGWTIPPDGAPRELKLEELTEQETVRAGDRSLTSLHGALPAVVPGCIIDYGYLIELPILPQSIREQMQKNWPVQTLNYRWLPSDRFGSAYRMARATAIDLKVSEDNGVILIAGKNLPAAIEEPWMPPAKEMAASVTFYYTAQSGRPEVFWNLEGAVREAALKNFIKEKPIADALASMKFPEAANLLTKLKVAHDWIASNIRNSELRTSEQAEAEGENESWLWTAKEVLAGRKASVLQMNYLFLAFARALGAEADLVLATNRTDHFYDPGLLSSGQFDWTLVLVRTPGDPDEKAVFVDIGSGLPFGELPWWITGAKGLLENPKESRPVMIPASDPRKNVSET